MSPHPDSIAAIIGMGTGTILIVSLVAGILVFCAMMYSPYGRDRRRGDAMAAAAREANRRIEKGEI